ncbi:hypothetical protein [Mycolicibacterium goodii]|uniref:hypothetical protein n=1 Tax=Mycolicibacterium goodii TaxID=134601 RepID=UPI00256F324A|nr:hypothetical protein [Mycolicibacterium goodii]
MDTALAARITTTFKNARIPTVVALTAADPSPGLCWPATSTMQEVSTALRIALP